MIKNNASNSTCVFAAKLRTSMGMHNNQEDEKSIKTSHEISDRDKPAKMLLI